MRRFRVITALFLALLWVPSTGRCLLAATFPEVLGVCCECEGDATDGSKAPQNEGTCNQCVTLETGVNLGAHVPVAAPSAHWKEDEFAGWMRRLVESAASEVAEAPPAVPVWSPPPSRMLTLTKALPVRGPSSAA